MFGINPEFYGVAIVQVMLCISFLIIFFFTYFKFEEQNSIKKQLDFMLDNITGTNGANIPTQLKTILLKLVNNINTNSKDIIDQDNKVIQENKKSESTATKYVLTIISVCTIAIIVLWLYSKKYNNSFNLKNIITYSLLILGVFAIVFYLFFAYFANKYIFPNTDLIYPELIKKILYYLYKK
jgi:hypothetical protein